MARGPPPGKKMARATAGGVHRGWGLPLWKTGVARALGCDNDPARFLLYAPWRLKQLKQLCMTPFVFLQRF